jgi:acyl-coenzyme A thioesterase PaaI-like protein
MEREYFYTIDLRGNLIHDTTIIDDGEYIDYFYRRLGNNDTEHYTDYPFLSFCGRERNYVRAADTPIVFHRLEDNRLYYGYSLSIEFNRENLRFSSEGIAYHTAPMGEFGRLSPQIIMELSPFIEPFGNYYSFQQPNDKYKWIVEPLSRIDFEKILRPRAGNSCAGCGQDSPNGLYLSFIFNKEHHTAETWFYPDRRLEGSLGIMHGGYVSLLLDEAMGKVLSGMGIKAPTANLTVRFRKPTPIGKQLYLRGKRIDIHGRKHFLRAELFDENNTLLAEGDGLFIQIQKQ